jgi:hypothetical protein
MSKSKIAIVIAPSIATWDRSTSFTEIMTIVAEADGLALVIPSQNSEGGIEDILELADGIVLVCPDAAEGGGNQSMESEDAYVRTLGRCAIEYGINALMVVGDRSFFGSDKEWQDWAFFRRSSAELMPLDYSEEFRQALTAFVQSAQTRAAFRRLARSNRRSLAQELKSPVTHS